MPRQPVSECNAERQLGPVTTVAFPAMHAAHLSHGLGYAFIQFCILHDPFNPINFFEAYLISEKRHFGINSLSNPRM